VSRSLDDAFSGKGEQWRPLYDELKRRVQERVGPFTEHCPSSGVLWKHTSTFGEIKFKRNCMEAVFCSDSLKMERQPVRWLRNSVNRVWHSIEVTDASNFGDLVEWFVESYVLTRR